MTPFLEKLYDHGPLHDHRGRPIRGADPEIRFQNGVPYVFHTHGPTAGRKGTPGIYRRVGTPGQILGPYSDSEVILRPDLSVGDTGNETFSVDYVPALGEWVGLVAEYGRGKTNRKMTVVRAKDLSGQFTKHQQIFPEYPWEEPEPAGEIGSEETAGSYGESSVCWCEDHGILLAEYSAKGDVPDGPWGRGGLCWRNGMMVSVDYGMTWQKHPWPSLLPPGRFNEPGEINKYATSSLREDPNEHGLLHMFTNEGGRVGRDKQGLRQWLWDYPNWVQGPNLLLTSEELTALMGAPCHLGAPSAFYYDADDRWTMVYRAGHSSQTIRPHLRLASSKPDWPPAGVTQK